jgi:VWFA-related protein
MADPLGRHPSTPSRVPWSVFLSSVLFGFSLSATHAQPHPPAPQTPQPTTQQNAQKQEGQAPNDEIVSHDSPTAFKVRVNLVFVRVVVHDANGKTVTNLKKQDFQLVDERKLQTISSFAVETAASHLTEVAANTSQTEAGSGEPRMARLPTRFVALFFDDLHLAMEDVMATRQAATKLFAALQPSDRIAIFTTSGQVRQDFTSDRQKLEETMQRIGPRGVTSHTATDCPPMSLYEAHMIVEAGDPLALEVANLDAMACGVSPQAAPLIAQTSAQRELAIGETELQFTFSSLGSLIRRMGALPGSRSIVLMSPGFYVTPSMHESSEMIDLATQANIVINTINSRGLYASAADADLTTRRCQLPECQSFIRGEEALQDDVLAELSDGTGGIFFHNRNDIDEGLLQAAVEPEVSYVLGFTPQNLKLDGKYHHLKVTFTTKQKWTLQARHGYFAPKGSADPEAAAKEEIQQAIFSQEEMHELPITCQTQFFKSANGVRLTVVAGIETTTLKFRKAEDRNKEKLMIATAIFDENGNLVTGLERFIDLQLKEATLERINRTGISVKSGFDLQPGTFLVRIVVRDSEGAQMAAINRQVVIP